MSRSIREYVLHIEKEADFLISETQKLDYDAFVNNPVLTRACERSFEIIGEASKQVPENFRHKYPLVEWRDMAGMRDKLIHHYFGIDYELLWDTIQNEIPVLKEAMEVILKYEPFDEF